MPYLHQGPAAMEMQNRLKSPWRMDDDARRPAARHAGKRYGEGSNQTPTTCAPRARSFAPRDLRRRGVSEDPDDPLLLRRRPAPVFPWRAGVSPGFKHEIERARAGAAHTAELMDEMAEQDAGRADRHHRPGWGGRGRPAPAGGEKRGPPPLGKGPRPSRRPGRGRRSATGRGSTWGTTEETLPSHKK